MIIKKTHFTMLEKLNTERNNECKSVDQLFTEAIKERYVEHDSLKTVPHQHRFGYGYRNVDVCYWQYDPEQDDVSEIVEEIMQKKADYGRLGFYYHIERDPFMLWPLYRVMVFYCD